MAFWCRLTGGVAGQALLIAHPDGPGNVVGGASIRLANASEHGEIRIGPECANELRFQGISPIQGVGGIERCFPIGVVSIFGIGFEIGKDALRGKERN